MLRYFFHAIIPGTFPIAKLFLYASSKTSFMWELLEDDFISFRFHWGGSTLEKMIS